MSPDKKPPEPTNGEIMEKINSGWHLDRKVTLALIAGLLFNAGGFIWYASRMDYTVQSHTSKLVEHDQRFADQTKAMDSIKDQSSKIESRLTGIETTQQFQLQTSQETKKLVEKIDDKIQAAGQR